MTGVVPVGGVARWAVPLRRSSIIEPRRPPLTLAALVSSTFTAATPIDNKKGAVCKGKKCCTANTGHADLDTYLIGNCEWARRTNKANSTFLPTLAQSQAPPVVWVGCADSRVPESVITNKRPGDIFVTVSVSGTRRRMLSWTPP